MKAEIAALGVRIADFERRHPFTSAAAAETRWNAELCADMAAYYRAEDRERRRQHWVAAWMMLTTRQDDLAAPYCSWSRMVALKLLCAIAMLLGRDDRSPQGGRVLRHSLQFGFWGLLDGHGYGDSWWQLEFSWREFRYSLDREVGEGSY